MSQRYGLSLVGFTDLQAIKNHQEQFPSLQWELSYKMSEQFLDEVEPIIAGRVISVHASCPAEAIFPNFGSRDPVVLQRSFDAMRRTFETARRFGAQIVVLHPGYVTDLEIPASNTQREALLTDVSFSPYVAVTEGSICRSDYPQSDVYRQHFEQAKESLIRLAAMAKEAGVRLAAENLNPRVAYLGQTPQEMVDLAQVSEDLYVCLDVGHLWIASQVYDFPYLEAIKQILATKKVITSHIHANPSDGVAAIFSDSHDNIDAHSFDYRVVLKLLQKGKANIILETVHDPERNTTLLYEAVR